MWARLYFAAQALAGTVWWIAVFAVPVVREATLGDLDPMIMAALDIPLFVLASAAAALGLRAAAVVTTGWTIIVTLGMAVYATVTTQAAWGALLMVAAAGGSSAALSLMLLGRIPTERIVARGPFAFRPASASAGVTRHVLATAVQVLLFWGFFLAVIPFALTLVEERWGLAIAFPPVLAPVGFVLFLLASGLGLWSAATMSAIGRGTPLPAAMPNRLVIAGPYRFVRNPMAIAGIAQGVAVGLMLSSWLVVAYAIAGSLVWNFAVRPHEEADLEARFGDAFRRYRSSVRCWWPRFDVGSEASAGPTIRATTPPAAGSDRDRSPIAR
ncbi:MAG TPA: isoprenylcysteine carboxylmethyltransferase family protein [Agromyces mariniharenae]|nr:isoprenylcysteine carboxylmethyltransferase family protein [Agromyces mariniharenae]